MVLEPPGDESPGPGQPLPRAFGTYLLFDRIGRGGMAEIFLARHSHALGTSRRVVVKEILPELSEDRGFSRMLISEAKLAAKLSHRNVVQVMDLGRESGRLFIAMEYVEGYDLNQLLRQLSKRRLPLPAEFALFIVRETLQALDYAHRAHDDNGEPMAIVHRDVSPSNVLVSFEGEVMLCDFGIARAFSGDGPHTPGSDDPDSSRIQRVRVAGKSAYMSPEHARGEELDSRSDLFAAGILLWELCAGRRLYKGSEAEMLDMARSAQVPPLPDRGLPQHERLQTIVDRALSIDPAARFQSAAEFLAKLDDYALATQMMASQLRFGSFLTEHFAEDIVALRRQREHAAEAAMSTPDMLVTEVEPVTMPSEPPEHRRQAAPRPMPVAISDGPEQRAPDGQPLLWVSLFLALLGAGAAALWYFIYR